MSKLRPECGVHPARPDTLPDVVAWQLIRDAVAKRQTLVHGKLNKGSGHCAMGAFWEDNPKAVVHSYITDEVSSVNDSVPDLTSRKRWEIVSNWLKFKVAGILAAK